MITIIRLYSTPKVKQLAMLSLKVRSGFKGDDFKRRLAPVVVAQTAGYSGTRRLADGQSVSLAYLSNCWQQCSMHKNT